MSCDYLTRGVVVVEKERDQEKQGYKKKINNLINDDGFYYQCINVLKNSMNIKTDHIVHCTYQ